MPASADESAALAFCQIGVLIPPGWTMTTSIPRGPSSRRRLSDIASSAAFDAEYVAAGAELAVEFAALLAQADAEPAQAPEALPPVDADSIAAELGLAKARKAADFGRLRRSFAFSNHPDRVAPHLRQRAMVRMQVANMLIDEAKNCTYGQVKMLLTRLGWHSTMVLTGDPDQTDLLPELSGLNEIARRLEGPEEIAVVRLTQADVVRHPLVGRMLGVL